MIKVIMRGVKIDQRKFKRGENKGNIGRKETEDKGNTNRQDNRSNIESQNSNGRR